jgi:CRISPR-associated endonuclease/helicase Cas3
MKLLAHNTEDWTQDLTEHLTHVSESSKDIIDSKNLSFDTINEDDLAEISRIIGACHDFGKATQYFQRHIRNQDVANSDKQHALISAMYTFHCLQEEGYADRDCFLAWLVVLKHHGDLESLFGGDGEIESKTDKVAAHTLQKQAKNIQEHTFEETQKLCTDLSIPYLEGFLGRIASEQPFDSLLDSYYENWNDKFGENLENYYLLLFLYSVLLDADKMDTARFDFDEWPSAEPFEIPTDAVEQHKEAENFSEEKRIDTLRAEAAETAEKSLETSGDLMTLTLPTGGGKTLTALNMALKLRERMQDELNLQRPPRIIYSLPFLSIIDQNHTVIQNVLEHAGIDNVANRPDILLRHDHRDPGYAAEESDDEYAGNAILLTEGWNTEIVNTTFVQFFETLFTTENSRARKFHRMANSIILLDEIQSLPVTYWEPVEKALRVLTDRFNAKIILMTATQPEILTGEDVQEAVPDKEKYFQALDRVQYEFDLELNDLETLAAEIAEEAGSDKNLMAVMNTRNSCKQLYRKLKRLKNAEREVIFLSTDILPKQREVRIAKIKRITEETDNSVLVITTQLIEAGVDIDIDHVWRDFAPLDSIVQTAGRCNREDSEEKGHVKVVKLKDEHGTFLCNYVYNDTSSSGLLSYTEEVLAQFSGTVSEADFNQNAVQSYFEKVHEKKSKDHDAVLDKLRKLDLSNVNVRLIDDVKSVPVFVRYCKEHVDGEGSCTEDCNINKLRGELNEIYDKPYFDRKEDLQRIKAEFHSYIVNVKLYPEDNEKEDKLETLRTNSFSDNFLEVQPHQIGENEEDSGRYWYDPITGFNIPKTTAGGRNL